MSARKESFTRLNIDDPEKEVAKLTLRHLTLGQLWALVGVGLTLIGAASGATYYHLSKIAEAKQAAAEAEKAQLQLQIDHLNRVNKGLVQKRRVEEKKSGLEILRRRVVVARPAPNGRRPTVNERPGDNSQPAENEYAQHLTAYATLIDTVVDSDKDEYGVADVKVDRGPTPHDSKLIFRDGTVSDVLDEAKPLTKKPIWYGSKTNAREAVLRTVTSEGQAKPRKAMPAELPPPTEFERGGFPTSRPVTREGNLLLRGKQQDFQ